LPKKVIIIGAGFAGLSASAFMAKAGWEVHVFEKHEMPGGRARQLKEQGFVFDMGPSWYWMPDVFERYFEQFGKKVTDYYELQRLDPSYRIYWNDGKMDMPASVESIKQLFETLEPGAGKRLEEFLEEAAYKYRVGMQKLVFKPGLAYSEFIDWDVIKGVFKLDVFTSMKKHVSKRFSHPKLRQILEFPVIFLGALAQDIPALYSLMNYADLIGGTWYPQGGMYSVVQAMYDLAVENGVVFHFNENVLKINTAGHLASGIQSQSVASSGKGLVAEYSADAVIGSADYHFIETSLLAPGLNSYTEEYWNKRVMAPSCILFYVGLNKRLNNLHHHTLFFDEPLEQHALEIYSTKKWPTKPLFYVSATSVSDTATAPPGCENLFFLIPVAAGLEDDSEALRDRYFNMIVERMEKHIGQSFKHSIIFKRSFASSDFVKDYNSYKGNAYGLANTLFQTSVLKPACRSKTIKNLFYAGQLTVPGPGVPPSIISGEVVAGEVIRNFGSS